MENDKLPKYAIVCLKGTYHLAILSECHLQSYRIVTEVNTWTDRIEFEDKTAGWQQIEKIEEQERKEFELIKQSERSNSSEENSRRDYL